MGRLGRIDPVEQMDAAAPLHRAFRRIGGDFDLVHRSLLLLAGTSKQALRH